MLNKSLNHKDKEKKSMMTRPTEVGPEILDSGTVTDSNNLSKTLDGDEFNIHSPPVVTEPVLSIPGLGVNGIKELNFDRRMLSTHIAVIGGIGTGKSNLFNHMISQVRQKITKDDLIIVFDTKGDFLNDFGNADDVVISNDERSRGYGGVDYWNVFNEIDPNDVESSIGEICSSLFKESRENTSNVFFPNAASDLLHALISIFYNNWKIQKHRDPTNKDLVDFIQKATPEYLLKTLHSHKNYDSVASYISDPKSGQTQGVIAEMKSVVNRVFIGNFSKTGTLSMNKLVSQRGGRTIFVEYDIKTGGVLSPIYSLLIDLALKQALSNNERREGSVYLFIDEFKLLPHLSHIDDAVNFGRSLGVKVFIALQSITQIYDNYGEMRAKSILSGFLNNLFFNVNNYESRVYIKEMFGESLRNISYGNGKNHVYMGDVVKDKDITRLKPGEMIVGLQNCEPFVFKADKWDS